MSGEKRSRTFEAPPLKKVNLDCAHDVKFLLTVLHGDGQAVDYLAPISAESVVAMKAAIAYCKEIECFWSQPLLTAKLADAFERHIRGNVDEAYANELLVVDIAELELDLPVRQRLTCHYDPQEFDIRKLIPHTEIQKWTKLRLPYSCESASPYVLVQRCHIGWCEKDDHVDEFGTDDSDSNGSETDDSDTDIN